VPFKYGNIAINQHDRYVSGSIIKYGEYSDLEVALIFELLNYFRGDVIEVGSNIGSHTVPIAQELAKRNAYIYAFEPQQIVFQQLCANVCINGLFNVHTLPYACSNTNETLYFHQPNYLNTYNFGAVEMSKQYIPSIHNGSIQAYKLDELSHINLSQQIAILKIDVEGFELDVLKGSEKLLAEHRPAIYLENDRINASKGLIEYLWSQGYELWWHTPSLFNPNNFYGNKNDDDGYQKLISVNMLALPKEKADIPNLLTKVTSSDYHPLTAVE
jgi:FkbM family methyltransferase